MFYGGVLLWNVFWHIYSMRLFALLIFTSVFSCFSQTYFRDHFGGTLGISMGIGSHNTSFGVHINGYYTDHFYQINLGTRFLLYEHGFGGRRHSWESRNVAGVVLVAGNKGRTLDFELDGLNHQTEKNLGIGFNYVWYLDGRGTSQTSGGFGLHLYDFSIYHENDIFGGQGRDRFRTGQFHLSYLYNRYKFTAGIQLWTGESRTAPLLKTGCSDCPSGYRDLRDSKYGRTSHGILYLGWRADMGGNQVATARIGFDAERIRHIFQNKLIHDLGVFVNRPTPHYPMLDTNGVLTLDTSKVRQPKPYLYLGANNGWAY